jgi:CRISPR system Cascade subunit CasA
VDNLFVSQGPVYDISPLGLEQHERIQHDFKTSFNRFNTGVRPVTDLSRGVNEAPAGLNLLQDPMIRVAAGDGYQETVPLPEVYQALMLDKVETFPALRPHQRHPWHAFLTQLGAVALHRAGEDEPPTNAADWRGHLRNLTADCPEDEPWRLVVHDITQPAFMQPPALSHTAGPHHKNKVGTPDGIDLLVTSRNHDLKRSVAAEPESDDWIFALVTLQTSAGFSGRGNYGISRMNSGTGSRPAFTLTPSTRPGLHLRRDMRALLDNREWLLSNLPMRGDGIALLWTIPWDGREAEALPLTALDPFYIEICRQIRLRMDISGKFCAVRAASSATRIGPKKAMQALKGVVGDPWTPINNKENKSLTLSALGFGYRKTADYLTSPEWGEAPIFLTEAERADPQPMFLVARGIARGQGKTSGYHERVVPFKKEVITAFGRPKKFEELGDIARKRIEQVGEIQRILRHAVAVFVAKGITDALTKDHFARSDRWAGKLNDIVDTGFFGDLQEEYAAEDQEDRDRIRRQWLESVINDARSLSKQAYNSLPCSALHKYRARVRAESVFEGSLRGSNGFPELFERKESPQK